MKADFHHATLAALAYQDRSPEVDKTLNELGYDDINFIDNNGAQVYLLSNKDHTTIAFRGTEPGELSDVVADLKTWKRKSKVSGRVHDGFYDELEKVWGKIGFVLATRHKGKSLTICGHSLGAAMATLCAARLCDQGYKLVLYTYGSPRVGNRAFMKSVTCCHHRWVNNNDAVTKVPMALMGFKHCGKLHYLNHYGFVRNGLNPWQRFKDQWRGRLAAWRKCELFDGARDHSVSDYVKYIGNPVNDDVLIDKTTN
jgi:triacylglycerol lipase